MGSNRAFIYTGVFLVATATLMLEILLTRIVSVQAWYHLAFFIISLAMLGMTAGALVVFLLPREFSDDRVPLRLAQASVAFAVSVPASLVIVLRAPLLPVTDLETFIALLGPAVALALPFVFSGLALTLALTRAGLPPGLAYGIDLCGAATGCVLVIPLLDHVDAASATLTTAALVALGGLAFALVARSRPMLVGAALAGVLCLVFAGINACADKPTLRPRWVKGAAESADTFSYIRWNTYSRVTVGRSRTVPVFFWGRAANTPPDVYQRTVEQRDVIIDGLAGTEMQRSVADPLATQHLEWDVTQFVHHIRPHGPAAIIGVGGGRDVVAAVRAGHERVLGLELNKTIVELHTHVMPEYSGLLQLPVTLVNDEARSYFARDNGRYTVITMPMIDTWAATGAGAFSLSENGLYTVDAWKVFMSRLAPDGLFTVSRWYIADSPAETVRLMALAYETLFELGVREPRKHVVLLQAASVATLLVSSTPFPTADLDRIDAEVSRLGLTCLLHPRQPVEHELLAAVTAARSSAELEQWASARRFDFSAPTDERPFFFNLVRPSDWLAGRGTSHQNRTYQGNLQATRTLVYATLACTLLAVLTLLVPLILRRTRLRQLRRLDIATALIYFALIGFGFMFVELAMLSRLSVFLGHPTLALAVVLAGIIMFTGIGSLCSGRIPVDRSRAWALYPLLPAILLILILPVMRWLMHSAQSMTTPSRIALSVLLIAPPALGMGLGFPLGLRLVQRLERLHEQTLSSSIGPWLWGVNGACGVCASGVALACSMVWGISTTLLVGAGCYALLTFAALRLHEAGSAP